MIGRSFDGSATLDPSYIDYPDYPDATVGWVKRSGPINVSFNHSPHSCVRLRSDAGICSPHPGEYRPAATACANEL